MSAAARRLLSIVMGEAATEISARGVPGGTVTFLLVDIEGSTLLWESAPKPWASSSGVRPLRWPRISVMGATQGRGRWRSRACRRQKS